MPGRTGDKGVSGHTWSLVSGEFYHERYFPSRDWAPSGLSNTTAVFLAPATCFLIFLHMEYQRWYSQVPGTGCVKTISVCHRQSQSSDMSLCWASWVLCISGEPGYARGKMLLQPAWWSSPLFPPLQLPHRKVSLSPFLSGFPSAFDTWRLSLCLASSWNATTPVMEHSQCLIVHISSPPFRTANF